MKKPLLSILLTLVISPFLLAQSDTLVWYEGIQLQATDFLSKSKEPALDISYKFEYQLLPSSFYAWRPVFRSRVVFDKKASSMAGETTSQGLRYAQIIFDIYGLHTRRIERRVFELGEISGVMFRAEDKIGQVLRESDMELADELSRFEKEMAAAAGTGSALMPVLERWQKKVSDGIAVSEVYVMEELVSKTRAGIFFGMGYASFLGRTGDYFSNARSFNFLFQLDVKKRSRFVLDMRLGSSRTLQVFDSKGEWESGLRASLATLEFTYGYRIPLSPKVLVVPYAGLAMNEFTPKKEEDGDRRRVTGYSPVLGVEFDHILFVFKSHGEITNFGYKGKFSYSPSNFVGKIAGPQLNFSLLIGFDAGLVRTKMRMKQPAD